MDIQGYFTCDIHYKGRIYPIIRDKNLVVDRAKNMLIRLISNNATNKAITKIGFGTSNTAPAVEDTVLANLYSRAIGAATIDDVNKRVTFAWQLDNAEANGKVIQEFGLMATDLDLFARRIGGPITKSSSIALAGTWSVAF